MTKEAWVTVVTNDTYGLGALVLGSSLRRVGTSRDTVVMVTPGVSDRMREELARVYTRVVEVDVLDSGDTANLALLARPELGVTFTKLHAWTLVDYTKCVFLDADTLLIQNSDELFEREELSAAPDPGWPDCFNSGVFVFVPNMVTYQALLDFAIAHGSFDGGDQGLLNMFFREWATLDIKKHLPFVYNLVASTAYTYLPALKFFGNEVKIVHFLGGSKPWTKQGDASSSRPYHRAWWSIFREDISPQLHQEMILCSSLTGSGRETSSTIQHKFQDPWSSWKPESDRQASNIPNHRQTDDHDLPISGQSTFLTDDHPSCAQSTLLTDDHPSSGQSTLHADEHSTNGQFTLLKPTQRQVHTSRVLTNTQQNSLQHHKNDKENSCTDTIILEEQNNFNSSKNLTSETQINKNNSSSKIQVIENLPFLPLNNKLTINNKLESDQIEIFSEKNINNIQTSAIQHTVQILETDNDLTLNEKDKTNGILEPCFLLNDSDSTRGEFTFTGVPGALARGDTEEWRKEAWESGDVDYLGRDSFDNIWQRICECVGITSAQPKETAEIQPAAGASDKLIEQTKEETPAKPPVSTQSAESPAPPSVPAEAGSQPGVQAEDLPKPAVPQETTAQSDVTQESAPLPVVSQELSPQESAPQPATLQETAPQPAVPLETTPQSATPSETVSQPVAPSESVPQPAAPSESVPQPAAPSESVPQPALPLESVPQPALSSESAPQPALSSESSPLPAAPLETACQPAVSSELAHEPAVPSEAVPEPAVQTEVTPQPAKPSEGIVQLEVQTEATTQPQLPLEVPPSESPAQPSESSAQTPVPADTTSQSAVPLEAASQPVDPQHTADEETKPAEISVQSTTPVEATVPAIAATEILAEPTVESKSTESVEQLTASPDISPQAAQTDTSTVPAESPIKPSETTEALAESAVPVPPDSTVPADASVQPPPTPEIPGADLKQEAVPVETEKKSTDSPKCTEAPEVCCRKPEACSKPSTQAGQSKESVCPKPEKKPKETPKLPLIPSEAPSAAQVETSSSEGAACPKEPGTPTVTPPSGPGSPLVADIPEVCKLQATSSQPSTPPVPETEGSEPPVPPKRKQAKNGKPVPKGGKK